MRSDSAARHKPRILQLFERSDVRVLLALTLALAAYLALLTYFVSSYTSRMYEIRKQELVRLVEVGLNTIQPIRDQQARGEITAAEARTAGIAVVRRMTYTYGLGSNYLFMSSYDGDMLVQPFEPEKEGTNQWNLVDANGKYIIRELIAAATSPTRRGFVEYIYPPPGRKDGQTKVSYAVGIPEWNAYIGTGMYLEDIAAENALYLRNSLLLTGGLAFFILLIMSFALRPLLRSYGTMLGLFEQIKRDPDSTPDIPTGQWRTGSEGWRLLTGFQEMLRRIDQSRRELKASEERFGLVMRGTNDGLWDWNLITDQVYFSPRWKTMLGYAEPELAPQFDTWRSLVHPDDLDRAMATIQNHLEAKSPLYTLEHRLRHKDGTYRWILARGLSLRDPQGKAYRMAGSHTDITERKQAEEAIRQSEKRFSQVFHASPIPISITAMDGGRYVEVNDAWLALFGYTREEVIGNSSLGLNIWAEPSHRSEMIEQLKTTGSLRNYEHLARVKSGAVRDVLVSAEVIELNEQRYNLSLVHDITDQKQVQQELERRVAERTHSLSTLHTIAEVISRSLDLKEILNAALCKAMEVMRMEVGAAYSLEHAEAPDGEKRLVFAARQGMSDEFARRVGSRRVRGPAIELATQAVKPVVRSAADYRDPHLREALELEGVQQVIDVPLFTKGKMVGAFNLGTRHARPVADEELALLGAIGQQVAVAVENAQLYDRAEQSAALAERTRLARELHDSVTQSLYSVTLYAEAAQLLLTSGNHQTAAEHLRALRDTAQEALREMRLLIFELRPLALERSGLAGALQERLDTVETRGGVKAELKVNGTARLPLGIQQELYHIAREALNNILKHAHAQRVRVHLCLDPGWVALGISDDGIGFDPVNRKKGGLGLAGMQERVEKMGGELEITSAANQGSTIHVRVPFKTETAEDAAREY